MPRHLFVYGTLRRATDLEVAQILHDAARSLGPARAQGTLYDFGSFPGAVFGDRHPGHILGDVFALPQDARLLALLDAYEGLDHPDGIYRRVEIAAQLENGDGVSAWSYELIAEPHAYSKVAGGDWLKLKP